MPAAPYASARPRADVVVALTWGLIALQVVMLWPTVDAVRWWSMDNPEAEWEPLGGRSLRPLAAVARTLPGRLFMVLYPVTAVFWCTWVHRTYRNLPALGAAGLTQTPGRAVAYYFIPVLNLFRPYQVMKETWRASDPHYVGAADWQSLTTPALLRWWWAMHVVTFFVTHGTVEIALRPKHTGTHALWMSIGVGMLVFDILLMLLEIRIVRELTDRQERRALGLGIPAAAGTSDGRLAFEAAVALHAARVDGVRQADVKGGTRALVLVAGGVAVVGVALVLVSAGMDLMPAAGLPFGLAVLAWHRWNRHQDQRRERKAKGLCPSCGYDLTRNVSGVCPECGEAQR